MTQTARTYIQAARLPGITFDEASLLQVASTTFLLAVARGQVDLNALARHEMACRGLDKDGIWVGDDVAHRIWSAGD
ncbi:MAG: hypothetical protein Q8R97_12650 [Brevundimonas sp.]|nr:hypothetical protein [Brevundimonas sp.]